MKRFFVLAFFSAFCLADTGWRSAGTSLGPINRVDCTADAGIVCTRTANVGQGNLRCANASSTETGCVTTSTQTFAGDKTLEGNLRARRFGAPDGGDYVKLVGGVSLPQSAFICANTYAPQGAGRVGGMVGGSQMRSAGQFVEMTGVLAVPGSGDAGTSADGGSQTFWVDVYNATTNKVLCTGNEVSCAHVPNLFGWSHDNCGRIDGGASFAVDDVVFLRVNDVSCLVPPVVNVCAEYHGLP